MSSEIEDLKRRVANNERQIGENQNAILALNDIVYNKQKQKKQARATPATVEGRIKADMEPDLAEQIEVWQENDETRVKCKGFIRPKEKWGRIHEHLLSLGFQREGAGKESYWFRRER